MKKSLLTTVAILSFTTSAIAGDLANSCWPKMEDTAGRYRLVAESWNVTCTIQISNKGKILTNNFDDERCWGFEFNEPVIGGWIKRHKPFKNNKVDTPKCWFDGRINTGIQPAKNKIKRRVKEKGKIEISEMIPFAEPCLNNSGRICVGGFDGRIVLNGGKFVTFRMTRY